MVARWQRRDSVNCGSIDSAACEAQPLCTQAIPWPAQIFERLRRASALASCGPVGLGRRFWRLCWRAWTIFRWSGHCGSPLAIHSHSHVTGLSSVLRRRSHSSNPSTPVTKQAQPVLASVCWSRPLCVSQQDRSTCLRPAARRHFPPFLCFPTHPIKACSHLLTLAWFNKTLRPRCRRIAVCLHSSPHSHHITAFHLFENNHKQTTTHPTFKTNPPSLKLFYYHSTNLWRLFPLYPRPLIIAHSSASLTITVTLPPRQSVSPTIRYFPLSLQPRRPQSPHQRRRRRRRG